MTYLDRFLSNSVKHALAIFEKRPFSPVTQKPHCDSGESETEHAACEAAGCRKSWNPLNALDLGVGRGAMVHGHLYKTLSPLLRRAEEKGTITAIMKGTHTGTWAIEMEFLFCELWWRLWDRTELGRLKVDNEWPGYNGHILYGD